MLTVKENYQTNNYHLKKGWEEFNDLMYEIAHIQSFSECIEITLDRFDDMRTDDKQSFDHVNRMKSLLHINEQLLKHLEEVANKTWDAIYKREA